jgi:hypothetical protein
MAGVLLGNPVLSWVGTRSYGLYLYHWPIYQVIRQEAGKTLTVWQFLLAMLVTGAITEASYRYVEMPIRKGAIGEWFHGGRRRPSRAAATRRRQLTTMGVVAVVLTGWAGVSIAMAPNRCVGLVECANEEGQRLIENASTTTLDPTTAAAADGAVPPITDPNATIDPTVTVDPNATTLPTVAGETTLPPETLPPETTVPPAQRPAVAIGESVMLGATNQLQAAGFVVNASESRQGDATANVVGQLRASGQIGEIVVIQVGTNGPVSQETYDLIMSFLPAAEVPKVVFLTVHAPGKGWIGPNNAIIYGLQSRFANVQVLDWDGLVTSGQVPGLAGDGIHLGNGAAKQFYANYIFGILGRNDLVQPLPE